MSKRGTLSPTLTSPLMDGGERIAAMTRLRPEPATCWSASVYPAASKPAINSLEKPRALAIGPGVAVGVTVAVRVAVGVTVAVLVGVGVTVAVAVAVSVGRGANVLLGRGVGGVGVSVGSTASAPRSGVGNAIGAQPASRTHAKPVKTTTMDGKCGRRFGR